MGSGYWLVLCVPAFYLISCIKTGGYNWNNSTSPNQITINQTGFSPSEYTIHVHDSVEWFPRDTSHTVTADDSSFYSGVIEAGESYVRTFYSPGNFPYHCSLHPKEKGTIIVTN